MVLPVLEHVTAILPKDLPCDGIGFEISHHVHTRDPGYDYEGKEILVMVLDRDDAWALSRASTDPERQEIVNRSKVYVSGAEFGLSLIERDPLKVQALPRSVPAKPDATSTARSSVEAGHSSLLRSKLSFPVASPVSTTSVSPAATDSIAPSSNPVLPSPKPADSQPTSPPLTQIDADHLGDKYQAQLNALAEEGAARFHFVDYAPPAFVVFHDQIAFQMTLRNTIQFWPVKGSIYRRGTNRGKHNPR